MKDDVKLEHCADCGARGPEKVLPSVAIAAWNRRPALTQTPSRAGEGEAVAWRYLNRDDEWEYTEYAAVAAIERHGGSREIQPLYAHPSRADEGLMEWDEIELFRVIRAAGRSNVSKAKAVVAYLQALSSTTTEQA